MVANVDMKRRDELAYLALYYAIIGNDERSEMIRRVVRRLEGKQTEVTPELVPVGA
jgi:hypothetical protein